MATEEIFKDISNHMPHAVLEAAAKSCGLLVERKDKEVVGIRLPKEKRAPDDAELQGYVWTGVVSLQHVRVHPCLEF